MMMDTEQMVAEMHRRPDAHLLVEWLDEQAQGVAGELAADVRRAAAAYYEGIEDQR